MFVCKFCNKKLTSQKRWDNHLKSKLHANKLRIHNKFENIVVENIVVENIVVENNDVVENIVVENIVVESKDGEEFKFIDMFSGIGGFHQAFLKLERDMKFKSKCILACDIDKNCREVYLNNYGLEPHPNIKKIDEKTMDDFDALCSGFPCQPFSNSGKKLCFKDKKGLLFDEIIRIAKHKKPKFMFLENVKHILKVSDKKVIEYIKFKIDEIGYVLQLFEMSPHLYGIPQQRQRIFFVCVRKDLYNDKDIELIEDKLNKTPEDILEEKCDEKYNMKEDVSKALHAWDELIQQFDENQKMSPTILINDAFRNYSDEEFKTLANWRKDYMTKNKPILKKYKKIIDKWYKKHKELLLKREVYGKLEWQAGPLKKDDSIFNYFIQIRQSGIRVKRNKYFPTLVAISQIPIFGKVKRHLTPRECARLQCFPEDFKLSESDRASYKQFGNAVNVFNTHTIIKSTLKHYGYF